MTTKFTITRMVKTMMPMTKLPPITKLPNASMTWPAALVPSWPCARIRRVEARLSDSRSIVEISSTVGKAENSSGAWMNSAVIRISTESVIEIASARSSRIGGSGRIRTTRMVRTPTASAMSPRLSSVPSSPSEGNLKPPAPVLPVVTSVMRLRLVPVGPWEIDFDAMQPSPVRIPRRFPALAAVNSENQKSKTWNSSPVRQNLPGTWLPRG